MSWDNKKGTAVTSDETGEGDGSTTDHQVPVEDYRTSTRGRHDKRAKSKERRRAGGGVLRETEEYIKTKPLSQQCHSFLQETDAMLVQQKHL